MALTLSGCGRINYEPLAKEDAETTSLQPLVQYAMDEAESGQAPAELADLATSPLNMPIFYGESSPVFDVGSGGGRHLHFFGNGHTGGGVVAINGTKVDALHGSSTATLEVVHQLDLCDQANDQQRVFGMGNGNNATTDGWLTSRVMPEGEIIGVRFAGGDLWTALQLGPPGQPCLKNRAVVHLVVDTNAAIPADRIRGYRNGSRIELTPIPDSDSLPDLGAGIDLGEGERQMYLGRAHGAAVPDPEGIRTARSRIFYAAAYLEPLSDEQIASRALQLSASDD